ncbi:MAG: Peptidase M23B, partial [Parcubacteria group bacterium GW2011_GWD2_42_14]
YTVVIPLDSSALNAENVYIKELIFEVGNLTTIYFDEIYLVDGLEFPFAGRSAYTAPISSVLDHHMDLVWSSIHSDYRRANCADDVITAYTGEIGEYEHGRFAVTGSENSCESNVDLEGYMQTNESNFSVGGQYNNGDNSDYLFYDGHTGYDFTTDNGTPAYATADGRVTSVDGKVVVDHGNGYESHYLHLTTHTVSYGQMVRAGVTKIGTTGSGHLHYTLMLYGERVDPYGWAGAGADPARPFAVNVLLWK